MPCARSWEPTRLRSSTVDIVELPGAGDAVVSKKGAVLDPAAFEAMRGEFYALRGWDAASGCQRQPVLDALGLGDVAGQVASLGWLKD